MCEKTISKYTNLAEKLAQQVLDKTNNDPEIIKKRDKFIEQYMKNHYPDLKKQLQKIEIPVRQLINDLSNLADSINQEDK